MKAGREFSDKSDHFLYVAPKMKATRFLHGAVPPRNPCRKYPGLFVRFLGPDGKYRIGQGRHP